MPVIESLTEFSWPVMFLYPAVGQSDFVEYFGGSEMIAIRLAEMFPDEDGETSIPWDYNNEYKCSNLSIYFEVHETDPEKVVHWESVKMLGDMSSCMRFFENARALKGTDGSKEQEKAKAEERKLLKAGKEKWQKAHSKHATPDPCDVVQVHPAATMEKVLMNERMVSDETEREGGERGALVQCVRACVAAWRRAWRYNSFSL